jgi:DnaJ-domain-containing protein 1
MQTLNTYLAPILTEIHSFLDHYPLTNEHSLIKHLQKSAISPFEYFQLAQAQDLFHAHFLCMHALYHLKNQYHLENQEKQITEPRYHLSIHAIRIERRSLEDSDQIAREGTLLQHNDPLEAYYLNPKHFFETREKDIEDMLKSFWQRYLAQDDKLSSLKILELPAHADAHMVQQQYRRLAQKHHPDKGGCAERFNQIRQAKSVLDKYFK